MEGFMSATSLIIFILVGAVAGWLAGLIMKGSGFGLAGNIVVGIAGAFIGGFLFQFLAIHIAGIIGSIITALAGAVVLLFVLSLIKR